MLKLRVTYRTKIHRLNNLIQLMGVDIMADDEQTLLHISHFPHGLQQNMQILRPVMGLDDNHQAVGTQAQPILVQIMYVLFCVDAGHFQLQGLCIICRNVSVVPVQGGPTIHFHKQLHQVT